MQKLLGLLILVLVFPVAAQASPYKTAQVNITLYVQIQTLDGWTYNNVVTDNRTGSILHHRVAINTTDYISFAIDCLAYRYNFGRIFRTPFDLTQNTTIDYGWILFRLQIDTTPKQHLIVEIGYD